MSTIVIIDHVSSFSYSNILGDWGLFPALSPDRDFFMIPGQKGGQRWENFSATMYEKRDCFDIFLF